MINVGMITRKQLSKNLRENLPAILITLWVLNFKGLKIYNSSLMVKSVKVAVLTID